MDDYKKIIEYINGIENEDENIEKLEKAMNFYCGTHDICEGFKYALSLCISDQYGNHPEDEEGKGDLKKLYQLLK